MRKLKICTCRIECEEIRLADGSTVLVCVACSTYAESHDARLVAMDDKRLWQRKRKVSQAQRS